MADRTIAIRTCGGCPFHVARRCEAWRGSWGVALQPAPIGLDIAASLDLREPPPAACPLRRGPVTLEVDRG